MIKLPKCTEFIISQWNWKGNNDLHQRFVRTIDNNSFYTRYDKSYSDYFGLLTDYNDSMSGRLIITME
jgi:hypothetical protein